MGRYVAKAERQRYTKVPNNLFNTTLRGLDPDEQRVYIYLAVNPAQTALGCYVLSIPALADDLQISLRKARKIIDVFISQHNFIAYDEKSRVVWIKNHLDLNPICSGKCAVGAASILNELPNSSLFLDVAREIMRCPLEAEGIKPEEKERWISLLLSLQEKSGGHLPELDAFDELAKKNDRVSGSLFPENDHTLYKKNGDSLGDSRNRSRNPYTVNRTIDSLVVGENAEDQGATTTTTEQISSNTNERWPLLARFAGEVAKYNSRPLCDEREYPATTLEGVEGNLQDLHAVAERLHINDVQEIVLRLRRVQNIALLRQASCPAVIIGRMAEYAMRDLRPKLDVEDYRNGNDDGMPDERSAALLNRS